MKLKNSTDWSDHMLRRMVSWCCKELEMPVRMVTSAQFRQRQVKRFSGHAYHHNGRGRIVVSVAPDGFYPWTDDGRSQGIIGIVRTMSDKTECLINITAHELRHVAAELDNERTRRRPECGSSERLTEMAAQKILETFRSNRESLLAEWNQPLIQREQKLRPDRVVLKLAQTQEMLNQWNRRLKLAQTKCRKYKIRMRYYERKAACRSGVADVS